MCHDGLPGCLCRCSDSTYSEAVGLSMRIMQGAAYHGSCFQTQHVLLCAVLTTVLCVLNGVRLVIVLSRFSTPAAPLVSITTTSSLHVQVPPHSMSHQALVAHSYPRRFTHLQSSSHVPQPPPRTKSFISTGHRYAAFQVVVRQIPQPVLAVGPRSLPRLVKHKLGTRASVPSYASLLA